MEVAPPCLRMNAAVAVSAGCCVCVVFAIETSVTDMKTDVYGLFRGFISDSSSDEFSARDIIFVTKTVNRLQND